MSRDHIVGFILGLSAGVVLGAYLKLTEEAPAGKPMDADAELKKPPADVRPQRAISAVA